MELNFCRRCGKPLSPPPDKSSKYTCPTGHSIYAKSFPAVGVFFVTPDGNVLLSERGIEPRKGMLDAFGGFVEPNESFEEAATRELQEELGLQPGEYEPLRYLTSATGSYPFENEPLPILSVLFWTRLKTDRTLAPDDDVAAIKEVPLQQVDFAQLHDEDIRAGIRALQTALKEKR